MIQELLDKGGEILLPSGIYEIGEPGKPTPSLNIKSNTLFRGTGPSTIIKRASKGHSSPLIYSKPGSENIIIRDMFIDGNKEESIKYSSNEQGIWLSKSKNCILENIWSTNQRTNGIVLEYCEGINIANCFCYNNLKNGFYLSGCDHINLSNCFGNNNGSLNTTIGSTFSISCSWFCNLNNCSGWDDIGASLLSGRDTQYLSVTGGSYHGVDVETGPINQAPPFYRTFYDSGRKYGTSRSIFLGMTITTLKKHGIRLVGGSNNLITNNIIDDIGLNGIMLHGSNSNCVKENKIGKVGLLFNKDHQSSIMVVADAQWPLGINNDIRNNDYISPIKVYFNLGGDVSGILR